MIYKGEKRVVRFLFFFGLLWLLSSLSYNAFILYLDVLNPLMLSFKYSSVNLSYELQQHLRHLLLYSTMSGRYLPLSYGFVLIALSEIIKLLFLLKNVRAHDKTLL